MTPLSLFRAFAATSFAKVLDEIEFAASVTNNQDRFIFVNRGFERLYGWKREEIIGMKPIMLMPRSAHRNGVAELKKQISQSPNIWTGRVRNSSKNGEEFELELTTVRLSAIKEMPPNLHLGIISSPGRSQEAISDLLNALCRETFRRSNDRRQSKAAKPRSEQILEMSEHGYSMKEIAEAMGTSMNTPYVILHRARRDGKVSWTADGRLRRGSPRSKTSLKSRA